MRIHIISDLHLEFGGPSFPAPKADLAIVAGDLEVGRRGLDWIKQRFGDTPVIYVLGNHEFYRQTLPELTESMQQETLGSQIHLLENRAVEILGWTILGCTLWTNFALNGSPATSMRTAESMVNDFRVIKFGHRILRAKDAVRLHEKSVAWLREELPKHDPARTIVVTHHAPSGKSEDPYYASSPLSPSFVSNLDELIRNCGVTLWVHGHTHFNVDYRLGSTRVLSNQRGYPEHVCTGFDPEFIIEL
jgi:predicted phosphodiesterase